MRDTLDTSEREQPEYYLPGMPPLSSDPGRVRRFVSRLFRRRGGVRVVVRPKGK